MQEIVPPKLNKDTGIFSLIVNRKNLVSIIGIGLSLFIWSSVSFIPSDKKIILEMILLGALVPFILERYGRPLYKVLIDGAKYITSKKEKRIILCNDICEGIIINPDRSYSMVYQIEPINLSMSGEEEIMSFKRYMQQALFSITNPIQIISIQSFSNYDVNLLVELERQSQLTGKLRKCCKQYLNEYQELSQTLERNFYMVITVRARSLKDAKKKLEEQEQSFGRLLEQTKVKLIALTSNEILNLSDNLIQS